VLTQTQSSGRLAARTNEQTARGVTHGAITYEITLTGQAHTTLRAEFDDCKISTGPGTTTLRAELPDQGALCGLVQRIADLGLEVVDMHVVAPLGDD
jgi:hypothetical protein